MRFRKSHASGSMERLRVTDDSAPPPGGRPEDDVVKLAYEAALEHLDRQETSLTNLRNRATWLLTAAGLLASLASSVGLLNYDASKGPLAPTWLRAALLASVAAIALTVIGVNWSIGREWTFGASASVLLEFEGYDVTRVRRAATASLVANAQRNAKKIRARERLLVAGLALLGLEVSVVLLAQLIA